MVFYRYVKTERQIIYIVCDKLFDIRQQDLADGNEVKSVRTEMSMMRWMCGFTSNERKKNAALRELLRLEPVSLVIKKARLRWLDAWKLSDGYEGTNPRKTW